MMKETPLSDAEKQNRKTMLLPFHSRSNFGRKILHLHRALQSIEDKGTLVVLVDAYDSIFLSSAPKDIVVAFERARHYSHRLRMRHMEHLEITKNSFFASETNAAEGSIGENTEMALIRRYCNITTTSS